MALFPTIGPPATAPVLDVEAERRRRMQTGGYGTTDPGFGGTGGYNVDGTTASGGLGPSPVPAPAPAPSAAPESDLTRFTRDYWAPDRDAVLAQMRTAAAPTAAAAPAPAPESDLTRFTRDYWAPDREAVLTRLRAGGSAAGPAAIDPNDPRAVLSQIYQQQGLDPNNPTGLQNPLANVDYFLQRINQTGGWSGGNIGYWKDRLAQEISLARQGLGNRQEGGGGGGAPAGGALSELQRFTNDYWAPDREQVLARLRAGQPAQAPAGGGGGTTVAPPAGPTQAEQDMQAMVRQALMRLMQRGEAPVNEEDLGIRQPYQAAQLAAQRQQEQERSALAERLYAQGGGTNELSQGIQQSAERNAVGLGQLKAGLIGSELAARRTQLQQALQMANAIGARQEAEKLQRDLAQIESDFRYRQLAQQGSQFGQQLGLERERLAQQGGQFGQELGFRQGQWNDTYGLRRQEMIDQANRLAMLYGMGG